MKNNFKPILISLVVLIVLLSITIFAYREELWQQLSLRTDFSEESVSSSTDSKKLDVMDLSILQSETMKSLEKQVKGFDYDEVCKWPSSIVQTSEGFVNRGSNACSVGTRVPFLMEKKN